MAIGDYYNGSISFPYIEKAVLLEDVKLPIYNKKSKLTRAFFYSMHRLLYKGADIYADNYKKSELNKEYKLAYNELKNIEASFYIPILTPTMCSIVAPIWLPLPVNLLRPMAAPSLWTEPWWVLPRRDSQNTVWTRA